MQIGVEASRAVDNKRIFVIDDDEITRAVLQFILQDESETHDLPSLEAAFSKAEDWPPNLLLLGLSVVQAGVLPSITQRLPGAAVLLVADAGQYAAAQAYVGNGAQGVLSKPLTVETVRHQVDGVLGLSRAPLVQLQGL
jgi:DNA-binding NtrC family response regulator